MGGRAAAAPKTAGPVAKRRRHRGWSKALGAEIVRRVAAGETLRGIGREPGMPAFRTIEQWIYRNPEFEWQLSRARWVSGRKACGPAPSYCQATAEAIFEQLCEGEGMVGICRDRAMPSVSTVYRWMKEIPAFREMVELAREIQADWLAELGWEIARDMGQDDAPRTAVKLKQLRWWAGKIAPRKYGGGWDEARPAPVRVEVRLAPPTLEELAAARAARLEARLARALAAPEPDPS